MPTSLVSKDQIAVVNQLLKKKWDNGGQHHITQDAALELPIPATPDDMTPEHYSRSIAVDVSTVEDATANCRMARFVIIGGGNVNVAVLFYNLEIMIMEEDWHPDPEECFLLRLRPTFETAEGAFEWIRSGAFMLFSATVDSVLVLDGEYQLVTEWSLADEFARAQNPKGREHLDIHLDCHELVDRENRQTAHIQGLREKVKALTGDYPQDVLREQFERFVELSANKQHPKSKGKK